MLHLSYSVCYKMRAVQVSLQQFNIVYIIIYDLKEREPKVRFNPMCLKTQRKYIWLQKRQSFPCLQLQMLLTELHFCRSGREELTVDIDFVLNQNSLLVIVVVRYQDCKEGSRTLIRSLSATSDCSSYSSITCQNHLIN